MKDPRTPEELVEEIAGRAVNLIDDLLENEYAEVVAGLRGEDLGAAIGRRLAGELRFAAPRDRRTVVVWNGREVVFDSYPELGSWYEIGFDPTGPELGYLGAPMHLDGGFDPDEVFEVSEPYERSNER